MNTKLLRQKVLDLAIHGRLVPQDPADEPASVLLQRIRAEKEQLVKDGKLKKKDLESTPISEDEKPFELPEGWEWCRWGAISFFIQYGYNAPAQESGDIRMVRITDIQNNNVVWDGVPFCKIKEEEISNYLLAENDILFARTGGTVGKSFLVKTVPYPAVYAGYLIRTRYSKELSPLYLKYFMESSLYWEQLRDGTIATAQPNCNGQTLGKMMLPLPPLSEQKRIVAAVEKLFSLIDILEEVEASLSSVIKQAKTKILDLAIKGKLVKQSDTDEPASVLLERIREEKEHLVKDGKLKKKDLISEPISDDEKPFELPEGWEWCRLGDLAFYKKGPFGSSLTKSMFVPEGVNTFKVYEQKNAIQKDATLGSYYIDENKFKELQGFEVCPNDIIVSCAGTIGETFVLPNNIKRGIINQALMLIRLVCPDILVFYLLYFDFMLKAEAMKESKGTAIKNIPPFEVLKAFLVPLPPLAEQRRIVAKIEELFAQLDLIEKVLN